MFSSGIKELDEIVGGFFEDDVLLLTGPTGTGKTILSTLISINNIKLGYNVLYILLEETKESYMKAVGFLDYPIEKHLDRSLIMIDYPPYEVTQFTDTSNPMLDFLEQYDIGIVVIDTAIPIVTLYESERERMMLQFMENMRRWNTFSILISDLPRGMERFADVWIDLKLEEIKGRKRKTLEVIKSRGRDHSTYKYLFDIYEEGVLIKKV